ncbi:MAG: hypothetical protein SGI86_13180 [Deltaproteobacteria bacterium]|nr:hypothetical protein [Deltaproteobacteria bacterium]
MLTVVKRMVLIFVAMMLDSTGIAASSFDAHSGRLLADWGTLSAASTRGDRDVAARIVNRMGVAPLASAMLQAAEKGANQKTDAEIESRALAALFGATAVENPLRLAPEMALLLHHPNGLLVAGALAGLRHALAAVDAGEWQRWELPGNLPEQICSATAKLALDPERPTSTRLQALTLLSTLSIDCRPSVRPFLTDSSAELRRSAVLSLPAAPDELLPVMEDADPRVALAAAARLCDATANAQATAVLTTAAMRFAKSAGAAPDDLVILLDCLATRDARAFAPILELASQSPLGAVRTRARQLLPKPQ